MLTSTTPDRVTHLVAPRPGRAGRLRHALATRIGCTGAAGLVGLAVLAAALLATALAGLLGGLPPTAAWTLAVFALATWAWVATDLDDTAVALAAALLLAVTGALDTDVLFGGLGDEVVWLLVAAFVLGVAVAGSGLADRAAGHLLARARSPRGLFQLTTLALVGTTFAVPSTSGRAALALPVFLVLARVLADRPQLVRGLALLVPTVVLLSAVGSLLGAGAHLVTSAVLEEATGDGVSFLRWLVLGLPLALVSSHTAAELVLRQTADRAERRRPLVVDGAALAAGTGTPRRLRPAERRVLGLLVVVVVLWCSEGLHGVDPAVVALGAALVATAPGVTGTSLGRALAQVPWSLLLFLAATLALGTALLESGAAQALAALAVGPLTGSPVAFLVAVVVVSTAAHLVIASRSARSAVLVPLVVALSPAAGVDPVAAALASTAAAGFCHTLPASAKPVAIFARVEGVPTYDARDLRRLALPLGPMTAALVLLFVLVGWPVLGLPYLPS
ncbi:anion transporter [Klenkia marina]|uniref:Anion transporter n=1 Tax=Klenkia marina TaxID=1960309 RepID=A0A1G4XXV6_9ACTN|nr:SLC13 family permease [Klenkia marina]SCX45418.1 anion transporter [Klenkia marina]